MSEEYKFQLIITPETYDYGEEEIVYRIYFDEQLISERSLPLLKENQILVDNFNVNIIKKENLKNFYKLKDLVFYNCKPKKAIIKKIYVNELLTNIDEIDPLNEHVTKINAKELNISLHFNNK